MSLAWLWTLNWPAVLSVQPEEKARMKDELEEARDKARRRSLGNIKFIGELFKLKMLTEAIMHDCVVKLLKNHDEESLECLCRLLTTIGKDLDFEKAKVLLAPPYLACSSLAFRRDVTIALSFYSPGWTSTSIRWRRSSKRKRHHPESVSCCRM